MLAACMQDQLCQASGNLLTSVDVVTHLAQVKAACCKLFMGATAGPYMLRDLPEAGLCNIAAGLVVLLGLQPTWQRRFCSFASLTPLLVWLCPIPLVFACLEPFCSRPCRTLRESRSHLQCPVHCYLTQTCWLNPCSHALFTWSPSGLQDAEMYKAQSLSDEVDADRNFNVWNYQNSLPGVNLLLARATNFSTANLYTLATEGFLKVWMMGWLTIR